MRKIFTFLFALVSVSGFAQITDTTRYYSTTDYGTKYRRGLFQFALTIPTDTVNNKIERSIAYLNGNFYIRKNTGWATVGGGSSDTASLSARIDARVKYSDTASMLSNYLRTATAAATFQPLGNYITTIDTTTISTRGYARKVGDSTFARVQALNYVTTSGARSAISMTTTGTNGAATYNNSTGVINVPRYDQERRTIAVFVGNANAGTVGAGVTTFIFPNGQTTYNTPETARSVVFPTGGVLRRFYVRISGTQPASGTLVFAVRVNGSNSALSITVPAGSSTPIHSDLTNSVTINAGDVVSVQAVNSATGASAGLISISLEFTNN